MGQRNRSNLKSAIGNWKSKMTCPSCGHDKIEGVDRCEECLTPLFNRGLSQADTIGRGRSVMEDNLSQLDQEFLGVSPDATVTEVIDKMKEARVGCALVL